MLIEGIVVKLRFLKRCRDVYVYICVSYVYIVFLRLFVESIVVMIFSE